MTQKITEFYSHQFQQEADVTAAYFRTRSGSEYRVYFYPGRDYFDQLKKGTLLFADSYFFGFTKLFPNEDKKEPVDFRVRNTICRIINEFFSEMGTGKILIFSYDGNDGRKTKRSVCFDNWFNFYEPAGQFRKFDEEIVISGDGNTAPDIEYMSIIVENKNPGLGKIIEEFQLLKEQLISGK